MEKVFNGLPSKKEYKESVISFLKHSNYVFEEETDLDSPSIAMLYDSDEMYQLSYETDELAPYLAIGKMVMILPEELNSYNWKNLLNMANEVNNDLIMMKMQVVKDFGLYFYAALPFRF